MAGVPEEYKPFISDFLDPLLAGVCVNAFLYGVTSCWQWQYWKSYHKDHWILRLCVAIILVNDTLGVISVISMLQQYIVPGFGNIMALSQLGWQWTAMGITTGISAFVSQSFLIYRVHRFTKKWWISIPIFIMALAAFGESIWVGVVVTKYTDVNGRENLATALTGWCAVTVAVNALLCIAVMGFLFRLSHLQYVNTKHLVRKLMITALYTGSGLVLLEIACLVTYLLADDTNAPTCLQMTLGRAYSLVLLVNLNHRYTDDSNTSNLNTRQFVNSVGEHSSNPGFFSVQIPELSKIRTRDVVRRPSDQVSSISAAEPRSNV